ncbi:signal peptidase II [bacterium]|nr:signal peptidase II [bacterium]
MKRLWGISLAVLILDALTKTLAWEGLPHSPSFPLHHPDWEWARLVVVRNEGLILGFLSGNKALVIFVMAIAVHTLQRFLSDEGGKNPHLFLPAGLVLGGAMGNLLDRMVRGFVVDFIALGDWPVFNVADAAVVTGIVLMLLSSRHPPRIEPINEPIPPHPPEEPITKSPPPPPDGANEGDP